MDTDQVIPQFTKAAAAGDVPDVQFLFNGIYHMENVWLGYLSPLDTPAQPDDDHNGGGTKLSNYQGKPYRTGFYAIGFGIEYNKSLFEKAGLDPRRAADDVGRVPRGLREAEGVGRDPDLRRRQGRVPRRVVPRQRR